MKKCIKSKRYGLYDEEPYAPTHPGELLADELKARHLSQKKFSEIICVSCIEIRRIIHSKSSVTPEIAAKIAQATGTEAYFWSELQKQYDFWTEKKKSKQQESTTC